MKRLLWQAREHLWAAPEGQTPADVRPSYRRNQTGRRDVLADVRTTAVIDQELRLLAAVRRTIREQGGRPSSTAVDRLLDERISVRPDRCAPGSGC